MREIVIGVGTLGSAAMRPTVLVAPPPDPTRPTTASARRLRGTLPPSGIVLSPFGFAAVLPPYAFSGAARGWEQIETGSRLVANHAQVRILGHLDVPKTAANRKVYLPSSTAGSGSTFRVYRIRYDGPSVGPRFERQYHDHVEGWIDAALVSR